MAIHLHESILASYISKGKRRGNYIRASGRNLKLACIEREENRKLRHILDAI